MLHKLYNGLWILDSVKKTYCLCLTQNPTIFNNLVFLITYGINFSIGGPTPEPLGEIAQSILDFKRGENNYRWKGVHDDDDVIRRKMVP